MIPFFLVTKTVEMTQFQPNSVIYSRFFPALPSFSPVCRVFPLGTTIFQCLCSTKPKLDFILFLYCTRKKSDLRRWNKLVFVNNRTTEQQREKNKQFCPFDMPQLHQHHHHHHTNIIRTIAGEYLKVQIYLWLSVCVYVYSSTSMGCSIYA